MCGGDDETCQRASNELFRERDFLHTNEVIK